MLLNPRLLIATACLLALPMAAGTAAAQLSEPPSTIYGSITDEAGEVPAGTPIEAYVGNNLCGESQTVYTGDGDARVTVYVVDVISDDQRSGCGTSGDAVRIRVGDRLSTKATLWEAGPVQFDIVFGENVTPRPIPTFTPTPLPTVSPTGEATAGDGTTEPSGTSTATRTPTASRTGTPSGTPEATGTGETSSIPRPPQSGDEGDGGGFPLWGTVLLALIGLGLVGAGAGIVIARQSDDESA